MDDNKKETFLEKYRRWEEYQQRGHEIVGNFYVNYTPRWFTFLGWLFLLGALNYIYNRTHSTIISIILIISYWFLGSAIQHCLSNLLKSVKNKFFHLLLTLIITLLFLFIFYLVLKITTREFMVK